MYKRYLSRTVMLLSLVGCSPETPWTANRWAGTGAVPATPSGLKESAPMSFGAYELRFESQEVDGVPVEGSYFKKVVKNGKVEFIDYKWMSSVPLNIRSDLLFMKPQKSFVIGRLLKDRPQFSHMKILSGPSLVLPASLDKEPAAQWKVVYEDRSGGVWGVYLNRRLNVVRVDQEGSSFIEATAQVFPKGPLRSHLQEVTLLGLLDKNQLATKKVKISTEADLVAGPGDNSRLSYDTSDPRFFQVQVFFYINQCLNWFEKEFEFRLPFLLQAETQKGYPDKTNTAFYFQGKIRLGDGDGEIFDRIPMDPSIVTHETMHAIIQAVAALPYQDEGGSLNEAFADFFTAVQLENPRMGESSYKNAAFKRTIENDLALQDRNSGLYHDAGIASGLLWSLRQKLGPKKGTDFAWQILLRMNHWSNFQTFKDELIDLSNKYSAGDKKLILEEMKRRGWVE